MTGNYFHRIVFAFIFLLLFHSGFTQNKTTVKASIDKNNILIGEQVHLTLEANIPSNQPLRFFLIDSISHFEIMERLKMDTLSSEKNILLKQVFRITSFDSGQWVIPSFVLFGRIRTEPIPVTVSFSEFDPTKDYHDVKDIIEVYPAEEKKQWWLWLIAGVVVVIVLLFLLFRKKKKEIPISATTPVDPYKKAIQQLEQIKNQNLTSVEFYSKVVDVFRYYILYKKNILSLQKTTDDLILQLKGISMDRTQFDDLAQALRLSDFVKFAKYKPAREDDELFFNSIKNSIETIEKMKPT